MDLWDVERRLIAEGYSVICGVDEAGRGPLAGPVCAAAVILPFGIEIHGLNDSKKLTEKTRERLYDKITGAALAFGVAYADHSEIDTMNILNATFLAMNRAIGMLSITPELALIDGNLNSGINSKSICLVGGDGKSASIAAASIIAKVCRDTYMREMAEKYPGYGFERHKGYGTKLHYKKLDELGPSEIHRLSFNLRAKPTELKLR